MSRGRLEPPNLDDRKWQDIVDEVKALIPKYAPEWTDHNPTDLGITLIELFAWLVEGMIYRLNRVPERNFIEFLNLLGITRDPATPASTLLTFSMPKGSPNTVEVPRGTQASTPQTDEQEAIVFETDESLTVVATNLKTALFVPNINGDSKYKNVSTRLVAKPLSGMALKLVVDQKAMIILGFDQKSAEEIRLRVKLTRAAEKPIGIEEAEESRIQLTFRYSHDDDELPPNWPQIDEVDDGTDGFRQSGPLKLDIPNDWGSQNPDSWSDRIENESEEDKISDPLFFIALEIHNPSPENDIEGEEIEIYFKHIIFNSVPATSALSVHKELVGVSDGTPFQYFELSNRPVFKQPGRLDPYDHFNLEVGMLDENNEFTVTPWTRVEDIPEGPGEHFRLDPIIGTINFGNFPAPDERGHGLIPPKGSEILATYRYVTGGAQTNVPPGIIEIIRTPVNGINSVHNPGPASGGSDEEAIEDAKRRAPEALRNRNRAVAAEDYEYLALEATTDIKKVRCLLPRLFTASEAEEMEALENDPWTFGGINRSPGHVNVIIIPDAPQSDPTPLPSKELQQEVSDYVNARRMITTVVNVVHPRYLPIKVVASIKVWKHLVENSLIDTNNMEIEIEKDVKKFLHPVIGGPEQKGWEVGQSIAVSGLLDIIQPEPDVGFISEISLLPQDPLYTPKDRPKPSSAPDSDSDKGSVWVQVFDYELICSGEHDIVITAE